MNIPENILNTLTDEQKKRSKRLNLRKSSRLSQGKPALSSPMKN